jgi:hypothetical protein
MWKFSTASSKAPDGYDAISEAWWALVEDLGGQPDWVMLHWSGYYDPAELALTASKLLPPGRLHGLVSTHSFMGNIHLDDRETRVALVGIRDDGGDWGVGESPLNGNPFQAGVRAVSAALLKANRLGEMPSMVLMSASGGGEEDIIRGIESVVGQSVPVVGGSCLPSDYSGAALISTESVLADGVVVTVMFPSVPVACAFHSGFSPAGPRGVVTRADGRHLIEIDGRAAREVYAEWAAYVATEPLPTFGIPLKRVMETEVFCIVTPSLAENGDVLLSSAVESGNEVCLMQVDTGAIIMRPAQTCDFAAQMLELDADALQGALVIYDQACRVQVGSSAFEIGSSLQAMLGQAPFFGWFATGEQGRFFDRRNHHGSQMVSALVFGG